ncbi:Hint domain-containing protein [Jhaorihella thermophila]
MCCSPTGPPAISRPRSASSRSATPWSRSVRCRRLPPDTPIATPEGFRAAGALRRGDTVVTAGGEIAPVLHRLDRTVPAMGRFRPIRLRAPYFGLMRDIVIAPSQRLVVRGSEVEYLFNHEAAMIEAGHLAGGKSGSTRSNRAAGHIHAVAVARARSFGRRRRCGRIALCRTAAAQARCAGSQHPGRS